MEDIQIGFSLLTRAQDFEIEIVANNIQELKNNTYQQAVDNGFIPVETGVRKYQSFTAFQRLKRMAIAFEALIAMAED